MPEFDDKTNLDLSMSFTKFSQNFTITRFCIILNKTTEGKKMFHSKFKFWPLLSKVFDKKSVISNRAMRGIQTFPEEGKACFLVFYLSHRALPFFFG